MRNDADPIAGLPPVVKNLLIVNGLFFLLKVVHPMHLSDAQLDALLGLHYIGGPLFKPWQIITYMFMHGSFGHLFFNMFALFMFGPRVEYHYGSRRFLTFYLLCGVGAGLIYMGWEWAIAREALASLGSDGAADVAERVRAFMQGTRNLPTDPAAADVFLLYYIPMVGASGAIFGVLLAFGILFPNVQMMMIFFPVPMRARTFVILYGALELWNGIANNPGDSTAHFAHLGGMAIGYVLVRYWERQRTHFY